VSLAQAICVKRTRNVGVGDDREKSKTVLDQHQALMWEVGELLSQWEMLQGEAELMKSSRPA
jgi:hypothetical protein